MFFVGLLAGHVLWVVLNLPVFPWFRPWDPYPFILLNLFMSFQAAYAAPISHTHTAKAISAGDTNAWSIR